MASEATILVFDCGRGTSGSAFETDAMDSVGGIGGGGNRGLFGVLDCGRTILDIYA